MPKGSLTFLLILVAVVSGCTKHVGEAGNGYPVEPPHIFLNNTKFLTAKEADSTYTQRNFEGCPSIEITSNGGVFIGTIGNHTDDGPGDFIVVHYSPDLGKNWQMNKLFITSPIKTDRLFDPMLFKDADSGIVLVFTRCVGNVDWDGQGGVWATKISYDSTGDTLTHTTPQFLFEGGMNTKPLVQNNQIIFSVNYPEKGVFIYKNQYTALADFFPTQVAKIVINSDYLTHWLEPTATYLGPSAGYLELMRTPDGMYFSTGPDGYHWTTPQLYTKVGVNADARRFIGTLNTGAILLVCDSSKQPIRSNLTAFLSTNATVSWNYNFLIDARSGASYPDAVQDAAGNIYITYDYLRVSSKKEINFYKLTEQNILTNQAPPRPVNILTFL